MKTILLIGIMLSAIPVYGQHLVATNVEQTNILYRGYENKLKLGQIGCPEETLEIIPVNCTLTNLDSKDSEHQYIVKPIASHREALIKLMKGEVVVDSIVFSVQNLPNPNVYWGENSSGSIINDNTQLSIRYAPEMRLTAIYEIIGWEFTAEKVNFTGANDQLSTEFLSYVHSIQSGEYVILVVKVKGEDGILRKITGTWRKV